MVDLSAVGDARDDERVIAGGQAAVNFALEPGECLAEDRAAGRHRLIVDSGELVDDHLAGAVAPEDLAGIGRLQERGHQFTQAVRRHIRRAVILLLQHGGEQDGGQLHLRGQRVRLATGEVERVGRAGLALGEVELHGWWSFQLVFGIAEKNGGRVVC